MRSRIACALLTAAVLLTACPDDNTGGNADAVPKACGLPTPELGVNASLVPTEFMLEGMEVVKAVKTKDRLSFALNNPRSVNESFDLLRPASKRAGYKIVGLDNEGFEAEIYLKQGDRLGAIQIRGSRCPDATVVF